MKKTALCRIIALTVVTIATPTAWAATEVSTPGVPSDYSDLAKWPLTHTESCVPAGRKYTSTAHARITDDKKVEFVLTTSLEGIIFRYRHDKGNGRQAFTIDFIMTEKGWARIDVLSEYEKTTELFEKHLLENGVSSEEYGAACAKILQSGFGKFFDKVSKKLHEE